MFGGKTRSENMINDVQYAETVLLHRVNQFIQSFKREKPMLLSTSTNTTAAHCVGQTVDLALFNNPMHF